MRKAFSFGGVLLVNGILSLLPVGGIEAKTVTVEMQAVETEVTIDGEGHIYQAWTFGNQFPGPVIRVQEGDTVDFTLSNLSTNTRPHSMDFHAAQTDFLANYRGVDPGQSIHFTWEAKLPGVFFYHCGVAPMVQHVARGMVGTVIVDPKDSQAMPKPDREYVLVQSELFRSGGCERHVRPQVQAHGLQRRRVSL